MNPLIPLILLLLPILHPAIAHLSSMLYYPRGRNPILYTPGVDPVMHLDYMTFSDTVFGQGRVFVVEFYADWCGHCRAFAPFYKQLAISVSPWNEIITLAAINCADTVNKGICADQSIYGYPIMKYFSRNSRSPHDAIVLQAQHSVATLRNQLSRTILNEYNNFQYPDWPNFIPLSLDRFFTYDDLWKGVPWQIKHLVVIFESFDSVGAEFLLDLHRARSEVVARRAVSNSPLVRSLQITQFPYIALFSRGQSRAIFMSEYDDDSALEVLKQVGYSRNVEPIKIKPVIEKHPARPIINCDLHPDRCRKLYYVSETDMLKAMRIALLDEVTKTDESISGENFTSLLNFVDLLASVLMESERAQQVFKHLRDYLYSRIDWHSVSTNDWMHQFLSIEKLYDNPFPVNSSWQHCKGSSPEFRGYTCGLWTTFHALTVHAYMNTITNPEMGPLKLLNSIRGWVKSFFGCMHCRRHFLHMTTILYPMTAKRVRRNRDTIYYLWRAHNIVNKRLHGDATEDPQFEKRSFPPPFLCPLCYSGGYFSKRQIRNFLLYYYGTIFPHRNVANNTFFI